MGYLEELDKLITELGLKSKLAIHSGKVCSGVYKFGQKDLDIGSKVISSCKPWPFVDIFFFYETNGEIHACDFDGNVKNGPLANQKSRMPLRQYFYGGIYLPGPKRNSIISVIQKERDVG